MLLMSLRCLILISFKIFTYGLVSNFISLKTNNRLNLKMNNYHADTFSSFSLPAIFKSSILLSDTSVSEEDVLNVVGQTSELPSPLIGIGFAAVVFIGVAVLQFSLGDLTKEEGQARVRDFLQTKRDTERKRGYFD
jgi:hypothetical protein